MAYADTTVPVAKSQQKIRDMIYAHKGTGVCIISQRPREGFEALVTIEKLPYKIRVMALCKNKDRWGGALSASAVEQEERRVWRVLYWHLKAMFEAADAGVIDLRDVILPYVVTRDGRTLSEHLVPKMAGIMEANPSHLLAGE